MKIQLTPSLILTDEHPASSYGAGVLLFQNQEYDPSDIIQPYASRPMATAAHAVQRCVKFVTKPEEIELCRKFLSQWPEGPQIGGEE